MRQSQKSNRTRSRGRKPSNPLSRSYDSNGPDVKIRGTASHIAEKYQSLARDASASGDIVMAENYYQHAEHYLRIIAAAQTPPREDARNSNNGDNGNNDAGGRRATNGEITGDEPQPEVGDTALEMEVAVVEGIPGEGEQPDVEVASKDSDDDAENDATPRRRRRTTYRSRKRPAAGEADAPAPASKPRKRAAAAAAPASEGPQPAVAED